MDFNAYQTETTFITRERERLLDDVRDRLHRQECLSRLEQNGVLHALQVLLENAIGKAKHLLKAHDESVPTSAYDAFTALARLHIISSMDLDYWYSGIGLRNRIVQDYMNININLVLSWISSRQYQKLVAFLLTPMP